MNTLNFQQSAGFPLETDILDSMQTAYSIFNAFGNIAGEKTILSGCSTFGVNASNGVIFLNGEVLEFRGGFIQETIIIVEETISLEFEDLSFKPVTKARFATFGTGDIMYSWSDFKRGFPTKDIVAALLTKGDKTVLDNLSAFVDLMYAKLMTIDVGAEVNVKSNWNENDPGSDAFIQNKPTVVTILRQGVFDIGNIATDDIKTVTFPTVGTNNYMVIGTLMSNASDYNQDNDVIWVIRERTNTSFKIAMREVAAATQNLSFEYILIPLS